MKNIIYILVIVLCFTTCKWNYDLDCNTLDCENGVFIAEDCECRCISGWSGILCDTSTDVMASLKCVNEGGVDRNDSLALIAIYEATDGVNWNNTWDLDQPVVTWTGVGVNADCRVDQLNLSNNNLIGSIPMEIGNLEELSYLYLFNNNLTGFIPVEISKFKKLQHLYLNSNKLTGNIPSELNNLFLLMGLDLSDNDLSDSIPDLSNLTLLEELFLHNNNLSGCYDSFICDLIDNNEKFKFNFQNNDLLPNNGVDDYVNKYCGGLADPCED